jgi:glycosyltransferase involved in cell wall biosynthesis
VVFFLGGAVNWMEISPETQRWMLDVWERQPNVFARTSQSLDELVLNGVMDASDVIFAAYTDFPNSSNILTKAAFLKRPVIVSDGFLMAERTREFQLGVVVPEGDVSAQKAGIRTLLSQKVREAASETPEREAYMARHSYPALVEAFAEILGPLAPAKRSPLSE